MYRFCCISTLFRLLYCGLWVSWCTSSEREQRCTVMFLLVLDNGRNATVHEFILRIWHGALEQVVVGNFCGSANSIRPYRPARDGPIWAESDLGPLEPFEKKRHGRLTKSDRNNQAVRESWDGRRGYFTNVFRCLDFFFPKFPWGCRHTWKLWSVLFCLCTPCNWTSAALGYGEKTETWERSWTTQRHGICLFLSPFIFSFSVFTLLTLEPQAFLH